MPVPTKRKFSNRTKARRRLAEYVEHVGGQVEASKILGCSNSYISRVLAGTRNVDDLTLAVTIEQQCGIPVEWWSKRTTR